MNKKPTPETDKFFATFADGEAEPSHAEYYARLQDLECERDILKKHISIMDISRKTANDEYFKLSVENEKLERERDDARESHRLSSVCRSMKIERDEAREMMQRQAEIIAEMMTPAEQRASELEIAAMRDRVLTAEQENAICREAIESAVEFVEACIKDDDSDSTQGAGRATLRRLAEAVGKACPKLLYEKREGQKLYGLRYRELAQENGQLQEQLAAERGLADRLARILQRYDDDTIADNGGLGEAVDAWMEARK